MSTWANHRLLSDFQQPAGYTHLRLLAVAGLAVLVQGVAVGPRVCCAIRCAGAGDLDVRAGRSGTDVDGLSAASYLGAPLKIAAPGAHGPVYLVRESSLIAKLIQS